MLSTNALYTFPEGVCLDFSFCHSISLAHAYKDGPTVFHLRRLKRAIDGAIEAIIKQRKDQSNG